MVENARETVAVAVAELMVRYSFELGEYRLEQWIQQWSSCYPSLWIRNAVIEALYQGRYKAISVSQLLDLWHRRGQPLHHFNREFERIVAGHSLPLWLGESAAARGSVRPEPVLIATDPTPPAFIQNGSHSSTRDPVIITASRSLYLWSENSLNRPSINTVNGFTSPSLPERKEPEPSAPIQPFQPAPAVELTLPGEIRRVMTQLPIQQFVPAANSSELHGKLKAIAQSLLLSQARTVGVVIQTAKSTSPALEGSDQEAAGQSNAQSDEQSDEMPAKPEDQGL